MDDLQEMYVKKQMSITEINTATGIPLSTIRFHLLSLGILRSRAESIKLAAEKGKLGSGWRGKKRGTTDEWRANISAGKKLHADEWAKGVSIKPSGYVEYTRGKHKGRAVHIVVMEQHIGRRLFSYECVHHKDENRQNNCLENLQLMTRSEHARHHALENLKNRTRNEYGQFE